MYFLSLSPSLLLFLLPHLICITLSVPLSHSLSLSLSLSTNISSTYHLLCPSMFSRSQPTLAVLVSQADDNSIKIPSFRYPCCKTWVLAWLPSPPQSHTLVLIRWAVFAVERSSVISPGFLIIISTAVCSKTG